MKHEVENLKYIPYYVVYRKQKTRDWPQKVVIQEIHGKSDKKLKYPIAKVSLSYHKLQNWETFLVTRLLRS